MLDILTMMDNHICWLDYFDRILLEYILILLETIFEWKMHSHVCRCPVELERNILLYNDLLSFRLTEYLDYEHWANMKNGCS